MSICFKNQKILSSAGAEPASQPQVGKSCTFLIFPSLFLIFPQKFLFFVLNLALWVGKSPTREGPGYATAHLSQFFSSILIIINLSEQP